MAVVEQNLRGKRVLVTGGIGYTGAVFVRKAVAAGAEVTNFDNLTYGRRPLQRLNWWLDHDRSSVSEALQTEVTNVSLQSSHYRFIQGDTRNRDQVKSVVDEGYDVVFHLAELVGQEAVKVDPIVTGEINYWGTRNVIDAVSDSDSRGVFLSSSSAYDRGGSNLTETSPLPNPYLLEYYARYKILGVEGYIEQLARARSDFEYVILRPATVGGLSTRMRLDLLPHTLLYSLLKKDKIRVGHPQDYRAFIDIEDLTDLYLSLVAGKQWQKGVYNVGYLNDSKWNFANQICQLVGLGENAIVIDDSVGDSRSLGIDSFKAMRTLGFAPTRNLAQMLTPLVALLKANPLVFAASEDPLDIAPEFTNTPPAILRGRF